MNLRAALRRPRLYPLNGVSLAVTPQGDTTLMWLSHESFPRHHFEIHLSTQIERDCALSGSPPRPHIEAPGGWLEESDKPLNQYNFGSLRTEPS